jgi:hypothetical protein
MNHRWTQINTDKMGSKPASFLSVCICVYLWFICVFIFERTARMGSNGSANGRRRRTPRGGEVAVLSYDQ